MITLKVRGAVKGRVLMQGCGEGGEVRREWYYGAAGRGKEEGCSAELHW